jgi:hypothetical protein
MARNQTSVADALKATQARAKRPAAKKDEDTGVSVEDVVGKVKDQAPVKGKTGIFKAYDNKKRPRKMGKRHLNEIRLRSVRDGNIFTFVMDDHGKDGFPNQATQQVLNNLKLKTAAAPLEDGSLRMVTKRVVNDETDEYEEVEVPATVPSYFLDEDAGEITIANGHGHDVVVPIATPEILRTMEYNLQARAERRAESLAALGDELAKAGPTFSEKAMG